MTETGITIFMILSFGIAAVMLLGMATMYFLPTIIALVRKNTYWHWIAVLNLVFGWTIIGWFVVAIWALVDRGKKQ